MTPILALVEIALTVLLIRVAIKAEYSLDSVLIICSMIVLLSIGAALLLLTLPQ